MASPPSRLLPLHNLFEHEGCGERPVAHDGQRLISCGEFSAAVAHLAAALRQRPEMRWLLTGNDPLAFVVELLAALYARKQVVIPPNTQPGALAALGSVFDARMDTLPAAPAPDTTREKLAAIDPHASIIDLYTSGSTGEHKCVRRTLAQFETEVAVLESLWGDAIGPSAILATVPHHHIYGLLFRLFWPLSSGRVFDDVTCSHPGTLAARLALLGRSVLVSSPAQLARLPELLPLASLPSKPVVVFSSGAPLPANAARTLTEGFGQAPIEIFGSTETGGVAWRQQFARPGDATADDSWMPFPCNAISRSETGALILRSPFLASDAPWEMDDAIGLMPGGSFRLLGRLDRVVKIEEKRLSLPDMESRLCAHEWIDSAAVTVLAGSRNSLGAAVVLNALGEERLSTDGRHIMTQTLRRHLAAHFDAVLLPRRWRFPDELPVNERGKVAHASLAALFAKPDDPPGLFPKICKVSFADGNASQVVLDLHVQPGIAHFSGHFPGAAILPGIVQMDWAIHFARRYLGLAGYFSAVEKLKFLGVVRPDTRLQLSLSWDSERRRLDFAYAAPQRKYSSGRIVFGGQT